jgi:2-polyprenyl-3-methyl-5-hydroxy-6-metoxy-1,4-benzoquinol methylase
MSGTHGDQQARRTQLTDMSNGYRAASTILAAVELGIFKALADGAMSSDGLAARLQCSPRGLRLLLDTLTGLDLLCLEGDRYSLHGLADEFLRPDCPGYMGDIIEHNVAMMKKWANLAEVVRTGKPHQREQIRSPQELRAFIMGMQNIAVKSAKQMVEFLDLGGVRRILDVGGGPGTYLHTLLHHLPDATGSVLDLPEVIEIAREQTEKEGLSDRVDFIAGDMFEVDCGGPWDLVVLSNIIHSWDEKDNSTLVSRLSASLSNGGLLVVKDFFLDENRTTPLDASLFSLNMLVGTDSGRSYSWHECESWLSTSGLKLIRRGRVGISSGLLLAQKVL